MVVSFKTGPRTLLLLYLSFCFFFFMLCLHNGFELRLPFLSTCAIAAKLFNLWFSAIVFLSSDL